MSEHHESLKNRSYAAGRFELEFDKHPVGVLFSVDGGNFKSEAIGQQVGDEALITRYPGRQKFDDITCQVGVEMTSPFWKWVKESLARNPSRRSGEIVTLDFDGNERARRIFTDALISEIQFPALDAASRDPYRVTVKISPEIVHWRQEFRGVSQRPTPIPRAAQVQASPSNFRFRIDGINERSMDRVGKVDALSIKQQIIEAPVGDRLYTRKEAGRIEFPNLSFSLAEAFVGPFIRWWEDFVGRGKHQPEHEKNGSIELLDPARKRTLATISFKSMGILGVSIDKHEGHAEQIRMAKVDLYVEEFDFEWKGL